MRKVVVTSENKDDAYLSTILLFGVIKQMSLNKIDGWCVEETYTSNTDQHFITQYTNNKMWIRAESIGGYHVYSFGDK